MTLVNENINIQLMIYKKFIFAAFFVIILIILSYIYKQTTSVCPITLKKIKSSPPNNPSIINSTLFPLNTPIKNLCIKTAYNCCCLGNFSKYYVNTALSVDSNNTLFPWCSLINCAYNGVRALDFEVFSLNGSPIISSSLQDYGKRITYKESYNYVSFYETMINVQRYFIKESTYTGKCNTDPLFLIFRVYSDISGTYTDMYNALNNVFGTNPNTPNNIYTGNLSIATLNDIKLNNVIIIVQPHTIPPFEYKDKSVVNGKSLSDITSLRLDGTNILHAYDHDKKIQNDKYIMLCPPIDQSSCSNYDSIIGTDLKYQFVAMNFQSQDKNLTVYNKFINSPASNSFKIINW